MKKYFLYILILITLAGIFSPATAINAQKASCNYEIYKTEHECKDNGGTWAPIYKLLAPLPCKEGTAGCISTPNGNQLETFNPAQPNNLGVYLNIMIRIFIGLCAVLSVVMIVIGGIEYMTSELAHTKEAGKSRITNAILGLIIALSAYALLYTINPDLLKTDITSISTKPATK